MVWYVYTTLFAPVTNLNGLFDSLKLATPLIFTGLGVAFGFRAGLFNIGGPGQLTAGGIGAMLVGVYAPLPTFLLLPATVLAAARAGPSGAPSRAFSKPASVRAKSSTPSCSITSPRPSLSS